MRSSFLYLAEVRAAMKPVQSHTFRGKRYKICRVRSIPKHDGDVDHPSTKDKKLRLVTGLSPQRTLEVEIHEALHPCFWDIAEEAIGEAAADISKFLWRLGYRKVQQ